MSGPQERNQYLPGKDVPVLRNGPAVIDWRFLEEVDPQKRGSFVRAAILAASGKREEPSE